MSAGRPAPRQVHDAPGVLKLPPADYRKRPIESCPPPATKKPTDTEFFVTTSDGLQMPNHAFLKDHFFREGRLTEGQALFILGQTTEMFRREPNLVEVESPVTICGDIHGQFYDLMKLFEVGGDLPQNSYLFLGDYVDRGCFGIECLLYLFTLKLWYPSKLTLLRGNHECRHLTEYFTFKRECLHKYSPLVYEACIKSFCALPVSALVDSRFFCVHGGISPELGILNDLKKIDRFREPGSHGLLCDLLWSDPIANFGHEQESPSWRPGTMFEPNQTRGCSFFFTYEAACAFLERNGLLGIIRGHEAQDAGYTMHRKTPTKKFPSVITIFSAPNYLDVYHNRGAILKYANRNITIRQYNSSAHPYWLPNFMDAFTWSLPFVGAKIAEMLLSILAVCSSEELEDTATDSSDEDDTRTIGDLSEGQISERRQQIKNKILAVGRMQRVFQLLRDEAENASELVAEQEDGKKSSDALHVQGTNISMHIRNFADARRADLINEQLPTFTSHPSSPTDSHPYPLVTTPSMRRGSADSDPSLQIEDLIKKTLEEEDDEESVVEKLADRIARGRKVTGRPRPLKRFETT